MTITKGTGRVVLSALLVLVALAGIAPAPAGPPAEPVRAQALLRAEAEIALLALVPGRVREVPLREGAEVPAGTAVVILDDVEARLAVRLAQADLEMRELELERLKALPRPEDLERDRAWYQEAKAGLELAEKTLVSDRDLHKDGIVSDLSRQRSERALDAARALAESRRLDLSIREKGAPREDIRRAEIELEKQRIAVAQHDREAAKLRIGALREGTGLVSRVNVVPGQWISAGSTVGELVYMDRLRAELSLPAQEGLTVVAGARATLRCAAVPGVTLEGTVVGVSPVVDAASGTVRVFIEVANPGRRLRPGLVAEIEIAR